MSAQAGPDAGETVADPRRKPRTSRAMTRSTSFSQSEASR
jgi:hypothetical protein